MEATSFNKTETTTTKTTSSHLREVEADETTSCRVSDGTSARVERAEGDEGERAEERLVVRDGDDRVLFEYVPTSSRCIVHVPAGDLVVRADQGSIELEAVEGIRLRGGPLVEVEAETIRTNADDAEVTVAEAKVTVDVLQGVYRRVRQRVDILETTAGRIMERARESYRDVESLAQTRAGRMRFVAAKTFHVLGERTLFKAHQDIKIKGEKIHLG